MSAAPTNPTLFQRYLHRNYLFVSVVARGFRRRLTAAGWLVGAGLAASGLMGVDTNLSLAHQGFMFLGFLLVAALVGSQFSRARFAVERRLPRFGSVGVALPYQLVVKNLTAKPLRGLAVLDDLADPRPTITQFIGNREPGEERRNWWDRRYAYYRWRWLVSRNRRATVNEAPCPTLAPLGSAEVPLELLPLRRGMARFDSVTVACPDPFGLCRGLVRVLAPQALVILPRRYPIRPLALPGTLKYQHGGVALAASVGESEEFVSLRDYRPGDPMRHLHWPSWAKTGRPIVREFQDEFFTRHALLLDTFGEQTESEVFEEAVSVAASLACTIQTQESLLDLMFVGPRAYCFTLGRGVGHLEQMLQVLAAVEVCREQAFDSLRQLVLRSAADLSGCLCVFLRWDEPRRKLVDHLRELGVPLMVFVIIEAGALPPEPGPMAGEGPGSFHVLEAGKIAEGLARV